MTWSGFFSSQLFGVIIGALVTGGFTWLLDYFKSKREYKQRIKQKREDLYIKACIVLMEHDKYRRDHEWPDSCKTMYNELQGPMLIYTSRRIYKKYYELDSEICQCYDKMKSKRAIAAKSDEIADKIEDFAKDMRKELGIKGA